ncbi:MAG: helix-turn-helix transcriptional regulator [Pseudomonadota bacterium]
MRLAEEDLHRIWTLSNELSDAENAEHAIDILFDRALQILPSDSAVAFPFESPLTDIADNGHQSRDMGDLNSVAADYATHYHRLDPLNILEAPQNMNRALRTTDVISRAKYRNSEFYRDFSHPLGIEAVLGVCVALAGKPVYGIAFHRSSNARQFSVEDRTRLTLVAPILAHSLYALRMRRLTARWQDDKSGVAVWQIESSTGHGLCNAEAERLVRLLPTHRLGPQMRDGFPVIVQRLIDRIQLAVSNQTGIPMRPMSESISSQWGSHWYAFTVTALPTVSAYGLNAPLVVTAVRRSTGHEIDDRLRGLGLTEREREITRLIVRGFTNKEIARNLSITEQTVKDHLRSIFIKADAGSRTRLIARLVWGD